MTTAAPPTPKTCDACGFHNMPGATVCLRCKKPVVAPAKERALPEEVAPPRAAPWAKRFGRPGRMLAGVDRWLAARRKRRRDREGWLPERVGRVDMVKVIRAMVPGWPLRVEGRYKAAMWVSAIWALSLGAFLIMHGSSWAFWALTIALGVHVYSACCAWRQDLAFLSFIPRVMWSMAIWFLLFTLVYYPAGELYGALFPTMQVNAKIPGVADKGDVVAIAAQPEWPPPLGSLVVVSYGNGAVVDRVLGHPGDHIVWEKRTQTLLRNGEAVPREQWPLVPGKLGKRINLTVPQGKICVIPTPTLNIAIPLLDNQYAGGVALYSSEKVLGRPGSVRWPPTRRGPIEGDVR